MQHEMQLCPAERRRSGGRGGWLSVLRQVADHLDHFGAVIAPLRCERQQLPHLSQYGAVLRRAGYRDAAPAPELQQSLPAEQVQRRSRAANSATAATDSGPDDLGVKMLHWLRSASAQLNRSRRRSER